MSEDTEALVRRLVEVHGEDDICPTAADWRRILGLPGPVHVLELLTFVYYLDVDEGPRDGAYDEGVYGLEVTPAQRRAGVEEVFFGEVRHVYGAVFGGHWDVVKLVRYPSTRAMADLWLDPEFVQAHRHRLRGVATGQFVVLPEEPERFGMLPG